MLRKSILTLLFIIIAVPCALGADQWDKLEPLGTRQAADIDTYITTNNEAIDRLSLGNINQCGVVPASNATITVLAGEIAIPNAGESIVRYRRNTSATTVAWSDIDTGAEDTSKQYYVYAVADTDATTFTVKISTNATTPTGS